MPVSGCALLCELWERDSNSARITRNIIYAICGHSSDPEARERIYGITIIV